MKKNLINESIYKVHDHTNNHYTQRNDKQQEHPSHHQSGNRTSSTAGNYNVNLRFDPITPEAGPLSTLVLSITDQKLGDPSKNLTSKNLNLFMLNLCMS